MPLLKIYHSWQGKASPRGGISILINAFTLASVFFGCARFPQTDENCVSSIIESKINAQVEWHSECQIDQISCLVQNLVDQEITPETAIQIALLNNPKIQSFFEEVGIAKADLIEAGLFSNPTFELDIRYPNRKGLHTNIEYLITSSILDLLLIPLRTSLAAAEFEQTKLRVSNEILELAFDVRQTYYELLTEKEIIRLLTKAMELTSIHYEIVSSQKNVGNINSLEYQLSESRLLEDKVALAHSKSEIIRLNEKLNRLLGFSIDVCLKLPENIPLEINFKGYDLCTLEKIAMEERLDLKIARYEISRLSWMLGLKDWWTYTNLRAGLSGEKDTDGTDVVGPGFSGEIPLFNYGQAARMRLFSQLKQAQYRLAALEIQALSEIREAHNQTMSFLDNVKDYQNHLLPTQEKILDSSESLYNVMGIGIDRLLENKRQEVLTKKNYIESIKNYFISRVALDRALGGYLSIIYPEATCYEASE